MSDTNPAANKISWAEGPMVFSDDVVLEASVLRTPVRGREQVQAVLTAAGKYYSSVVFTHTVTDGDRTYMEWDAAGPSGTSMSGITILTRDADEVIRQVAIHHRPLGAALEFSRDLGKLTEGVVPAGSFDDGH